MSPQKGASAAEKPDSDLEEKQTRELTLSDVFLELKSLRETVATKDDLATLKSELEYSVTGFVTQGFDLLKRS